MSDAALSALECSGLELEDEPGLVAKAWTGRTLVFEEADRDALFLELTEMSNSEDATAEDTNEDPDIRKYARRAARSLGTLASHVLRAE